MSFYWLRISGLALGLGAALGSSMAATTRYTVTDLGFSTESAWTAVYGINAQGVVAANWRDGTGLIYPDGTRVPLSFAPVGLNAAAAAVGNAGDAVLDQDGVVTHLGTLPGGFTTSATAINASGTIVGNSRALNDAGSDQSVAFIYQGGAMRALLSGSDRSQATGVNNRNMVVGTVIASKRKRAFFSKMGS